MTKFTEILKTLAKSAAVVGMLATAGVAGTALSITPAAAQMHGGGGGGGFHGGGGFGGGGFHGGGFHGSAGAFRGGEGGFRGDRGGFRGDFHRGEWRGGRWVGWYGADVYPYDDPYGCSYYDYYYGYCAY